MFEIAYLLLPSQKRELLDGSLFRLFPHNYLFRVAE